MGVYEMVLFTVGAVWVIATGYLLFLIVIGYKEVQAYKKLKEEFELKKIDEVLDAVITKEMKDRSVKDGLA